MNIENTTCTHCGKRSYPTRKDARRAGKILHPENRLNTYRCPHIPTTETEQWHLGRIRSGADRARDRRTVERQETA